MDNLDLDKLTENNQERDYFYQFDRQMHQFMVRKFLPYFSDKPNTALELGCFEGAFSTLIQPYFSQLTLVEGAEKAAEKTRHLFSSYSLAATESIEVICERFENLQLNQQFDAVFLLHVLEHIEVPSELFQRIKQWLAPQGRLFIACPNAMAASRQIAVKMGLISEPEAVTDGERLHGHYRTYALHTLSDEVDRVGLTIIESGGICFKPLANFQLDKAYEQKIIDDAFLEGCFKLGDEYPALCASIFVVATLPN
ncbi:class I SAM-dependent methyltransferase [Zooshikella ganghwensis]|uniref:class I SAM-dependent methyltransferase n=1 Tax=Zooshikella ganghwensis TaxID=202772 RepID=UPI0003FF1207|nr:class I SAM-dependent methyltransferase [Zooshikella ganghwensis]